MRARHRGFTLIETMIAIALFVILLPVAFFLITSFRRFSHEEDYKYALFQAKNQAKMLTELPFDRVPPEVRTVPPDGIVTLSQRRVIPDSIRIYCGGKEIKKDYFVARGDSLTVQKSLAGKTVVLEYDFALPDQGEAATIPDHPPFEISLLNSPIKEIIDIKSIHGRTGLPVVRNSYTIDSRKEKLIFSGAMKGNVIECSYIGSRIGNSAGGSFLTEALLRTHTPTDLKSLSIAERYGEGSGRFKISFIKVKR